MPSGLLMRRLPAARATVTGRARPRWLSWAWAPSRFSTAPASATTWPRCAVKLIWPPPSTLPPMRGSVLVVAVLLLAGRGVAPVRRSGRSSAVPATDRAASAPSQIAWPAW